MSVYSSKPVTVHQSVNSLCEKFSDFTAFKQRLDKLPEEQRQALGDVDITPDTIVLSTPQMGRVTLKAVERSPKGLVLEAEGTPVPMFFKVDLKPVDEDNTEVSGAIDVDLPVILKPMVGPMLQKFANKFGELFASLA